MAAHFQDLVVAASEASGNPKLLHLALCERGLLKVDLGDFEGAVLDLERAREISNRFSDPASKRRLEADLAILAAAVGTESGEVVASDLNRAIARYESWGFLSPTAAGAYEHRSRLEEREGHLSASARDLESALEIHENRLLHSEKTSLRWTIHQRAQGLYGRAASLFLDAGETVSSLRIAERAYRFSLYSLDYRALSSEAPGIRLPSSPSELMQAIPPSVTVLMFLSNDEESILWLLSHHEIRTLRLPIAREELRRQIREIRRMLESGGPGPDSEDIAQALGNLMLGPLLDAIPGDHTLVILASGELRELPFAALRPKGRLVLEDHRVVYSSSLAPWRSEAEAIETSDTHRAVVIGNPALEGTSWASLGELPEARTEAKAIADLYPHSTLLLGARSTASAFKALATSATVLHFAGHAILSPTHPDRSVLLFSAETKIDEEGGNPSDGAVYQDEIYDLYLEGSPIVFLSACETSSLTGSPGEGLSSLSRAFLSAGASAVVGTLWPVRDETAAAIAVDFHRALIRGALPSEALRRAQLAYLENRYHQERDPHGWAAFQLVSHSP